MKKCIIASDSFKGTLSTIEICNIVKDEISKADPACELVCIPVADGGEGTVSCFVEGVGANPIIVPAEGPLEDKLDAAYAIMGDTAIIEIAACCGLSLVGDKKDPSKTSSFGVGRLIMDAKDKGCTRILLGLGGSATNDAGCGMLATLGAKFYDKKGAAFLPVGGSLIDITHIETEELKKNISGLTFTLMCDVDNPLFGENGAAYVYAPQKGADEAMVKSLDEGLRNFSKVVMSDLHVDVSNIPGAGAAGGIGAGGIAFLNADVVSGINAILDVMNYDETVKDANLIITGEGKIDSQSVRGKVISGITKRAGDTPVVALVGTSEDDTFVKEALGLAGIYKTNKLDRPFEEIKDTAEHDYRIAVRELLEEWK